MTKLRLYSAHAEKYNDTEKLCCWARHKYLSPYTGKAPTLISDNWHSAATKLEKAAKQDEVLRIHTKYNG